MCAGRNHDAATGKWFSYNSECSKCYLGHSHTIEQHIESIVHSRATDKMNKPRWSFNANDYEQYIALKDSIMKEVRNEVKIYDEYGYS